MDKAKSIFTSKTFWFNLATTVGVVAGVLPPVKAVIVAATVANIGLRLMTTKPIAEVTDQLH